MSKLRLREVKSSVQDHTATEKQNWDPDTNGPHRHGIPQNPKGRGLETPGDEEMSQSSRSSPCLSPEEVESAFLHAHHPGPFFWLTDLDFPLGNTLTPRLGFVVQVGLSFSQPTHPEL